MKTKIYNYADSETEIKLQNKPIEIMFVEIISGDEVLTVIYEDHTIDRFDADGWRTASYADASYPVPKEYLNEWFNFDPEKDLDPKYPTRYSYARQEKFFKLLGL